MQSSKFIKEVKRQLEKSSDINSFISDGENILHKTVKGCGRLDVVEYLLGRGSDVHSTTDYGANVIHLAIESMKKKNFASTKRLIKYFIDKKVEVNACDGAGDSVFHYLIKNCKNTNQVISLTDLLLQSDAQINTSNNLGETALHLAVEFGNHALSEYLISAGANVDSRTNQFKSALQISIENCNLQVTKLLIQSKASIREKFGNQDGALHSAIKFSKPGKVRMDLVKVLLDGGADMNACDSSLSTSLHLALRDEDEECARLLINRGCSVNCRDKREHTPLRIAVVKGFRNIVEDLLIKGADPNSFNFWHIDVYKFEARIIHKAIWIGNLSIVQLLVKYGVNMSEDDISCYLIRSVQRNHVPLVKYFLAKGADVNCKQNGVYPLSAVLNIRVNVPENMLQLIIDRGADVVTGSPLGILSHGYCRRNELCLMRHLALLTAENQDAGGGNLALLAQRPRYEKYYSLCVQELQLMKSRLIPRSNLTLYDVLLKKDNGLAKCVQNESIVNLMKSDETLSKYPKYSWNLRYRLAQGQERLSLISKGRRFFSIAIPLEIPLEILNLICEQLSNEDLMSLSEVRVKNRASPPEFFMILREGRKRKYFPKQQV